MGNKNSGRRAKPTSLKVLRGERKDRLNPFEPKPPSGEVVKPETLSAGASKVWDDVAPICVAMGTLTLADVKSFSTFCELQDTLEQASSSKNSDTFRAMTLAQEDSENPQSAFVVVIDRALKLERDTALALKTYYERFGLDPVGRARIQVPKRDEPVSKFAAMGL